MDEKPLIDFLMEGDVSIRYQTERYLLDLPESIWSKTRARIPLEGFGSRLLELRDPETFLWGNGVYSPKWISTHYTLLELLAIGCDLDRPDTKKSATVLIDAMWHDHGLVRRGRYQDMCVCAMILRITCECGLHLEKMDEIVDYILAHQFSDGGWNCSWSSGAVKSSLHTTISVLEAFRDYERLGYAYRLEDIRNAVPRGIEFMLKKRLFRSVRTGEVIDQKMLMMSFPYRWHYDALRALVYLSSVNWPYDERIEEAIQYLLEHRTKTGKWKMQTARPNFVHFKMEENGKDSRWNTLRVLRVLKTYKPERYNELTK